MKVRDPYLSVEVEKNQFKDLKKDLYNKLISIGFKEIKILKDPHISIAYIKGQDSLSKLKILIKKICKHPFIMTSNGIKCIDSSFYQGTIVSLSLNHSKDFPGGFQAHISLFVLKNMSIKDKRKIESVLSKELKRIEFKKDIKGKNICLYNKDRKIIIDQPLC